ncbi:hypothetical protein ABPG77_002276 [Micractinium sp. CCAP 211/92]
MRASSATSRPAASSLGRAAGAERSSGASALVSLPQRPCRAAQPPRVVCGSRGPAPGDAPVTARQNSPARLAPSAVNNIIPAPAQLHCEVQQQPTEACQPSSALAAPAADCPSTEPLLLQPGSAGPRAPLTSRPAAAANGSLEGMHRPVGLVVGSAWLLATSVQLAGAAALTPLWLPAVAGGLLGCLASAAGVVGVKRLWRAPKAPLRVVITGGSSGIGKALAREFLRCGDRVLVTSRSKGGAQRAAQQLRHETGPDVDVQGVACDVSDPASVDALMAAAQEKLGGIDVLVNNAGYSGSFKSLVDLPPEQVVQVVRTNLVGTLLATRAGMRAMAAQPGGAPGHIFNLEGAGSDGIATPQYATYGATKAAIAQLLRSLQHEAAALQGPSPVCVHNLSPGMVLTELLLEGATPQNKQVFNILCEHPETVAAFLVPRARSVVAHRASGAAIRYLTPYRVLLKLLAAPLNIGRYFDAEGRPVYLPESERLSGRHARLTQRLQKRAARRSGSLQLAYSLSMALSFFLIVSDALAKAPPPGQ